MIFNRNNKGKKADKPKKGKSTKPAKVKQDTKKPPKWAEDKNKQAASAKKSTTPNKPKTSKGSTRASPPSPPSVQKRKIVSHWRRGKRSYNQAHPLYLYKKDGNNIYECLSVTHATHTQGVKNIPLDNNPDPNDPKRKSYARPYRFKAKENSLKPDKLDFNQLSEKEMQRFLKKAKHTKRKPNETFKDK